MQGTALFAVTAESLAIGVLVDAVQAEADARSGSAGTAGAVVTFVGTVRAQNSGHRVLRLEYEAYEPLAVKTFGQIGREASETWSSVVLGIHHRVGVLPIGECSVVIAAASPHRADGFAACRFAIERIKQIAPIWKHEFFEGGDVWIEGPPADPSDEEQRREALSRACE
jgi:molybdopterin synthase catalytic subunit